MSRFLHQTSTRTNVRVLCLTGFPINIFRLLCHFVLDGDFYMALNFVVFPNKRVSLILLTDFSDCDIFKQRAKIEEIKRHHVAQHACFLSSICVSSVFRVDENDLKTLRVDAQFFENGEKSCLFQTKTDTCGRGLRVCHNLSVLKICHSASLQSAYVAHSASSSQGSDLIMNTAQPSPP